MAGLKLNNLDLGGKPLRFTFYVLRFVFAPLQFFPVRYIMDTKVISKKSVFFSRTTVSDSLKRQSLFHIMSNQNQQLNIIETTYLYKKTEKLVSALYLVSNFLSDKEPIKWQLRESGIDLLSQNMSVSLINKILSLLQVAHIGGLVSEMNFTILKFEFESLIQAVEQAEKESLKGHVLSEQFFTVSNQGETLNREKGFSLGTNNPKGHNVMSDRMSVKNTELKQKDKSNRQDIIIGLLKKGGELGIKDFTSAIKGCSEKTIQRELVVLVSKGQIKKAGEKRWSRYSLK